MLERVDEAIEAREYKKYQGGFWTLDFLAEMQADGRWKMETSLNGRMLADVETKGAPSKRITLQALTVLQQFGRLRG